ncbi:hypothetical protein ACMXYQ_05070 [Neptuniibacter sp. PT34_22]|uniref:hypothetical protein n=1 Tax=Neptuniibacter sp. PT34_22 TaxID=3398205 RepID=UPI0039F63E59
MFGNENKLKDFKYLWKLDDPAWLKERTAEWRGIERYYKEGNRRSRKELKDYKGIFLKGELFNYTPPIVLWALVPIKTSADAKNLMYSKLFNDVERGDLFNGSIFSFFDVYPAPWLNRTFDCFCEGVLGKEYRDMGGVVDIHGQPIVTGQSPSFLVNSFFVRLSLYFDGELDLDILKGGILMLDYVLSALDVSERDIHIGEEVYNRFFDSLDRFNYPSDNDIKNEVYMAILSRKEEIDERWVKRLEYLKVKS